MANAKKKRQDVSDKPFIKFAKTACSLQDYHEKLLRLGNNFNLSLNYNTLDELKELIENLPLEGIEELLEAMPGPLRILYNSTKAYIELRKYVDDAKQIVNLLNNRQKNSEEQNKALRDKATFFCIISTPSAAFYLLTPMLATVAMLIPPAKIAYYAFKLLQLPIELSKIGFDHTKQTTPFYNEINKLNKQYSNKEISIKEYTDKKQEIHHLINYQHSRTVFNKVLPSLSNGLFSAGFLVGTVFLFIPGLEFIGASIIVCSVIGLIANNILLFATKKMDKTEDITSKKLLSKDCSYSGFFKKPPVKHQSKTIEETVDESTINNPKEERVNLNLTSMKMI